LKVPGSDIVRNITWESTGLRVAMGVGSVIFFANIRPNHQWTWMDGRLVFGYQKSNRIENCVVFWDSKANSKNLKYVKNLIWIKSAGGFCCIENCVVFWDSKSNSKNLKYVKNLVWIKSAGGFCCIVSKSDESDDLY
jgi:WD repeat-containing protein 35